MWFRTTGNPRVMKHCGLNTVVVHPHRVVFPLMSGPVGKRMSIMGLKSSSTMVSRCVQDDVVAGSFTTVEEFMVGHGIETVGESVVQQQRVVKNIKCIVFEESKTRVFVVVVDQDTKVSLVKLARVLGVRRQDIGMVPGELLVAKTGYRRGDIPPFGFAHDCDITRVIDQGLLGEEDGLVRFGPAGMEVCIRARDLVLEDDGVSHVASVAAEDSHAASSHDVLVSIPEEEDGGLSVIVHIVRKRKLAKRLVFATVVPCVGGRPVGTAYSIRGRNPKKSTVWKHPVSGEPCELQCIFGKSLEKRYGKSVMEGLLKKIVKGGYLRVTGRIQHATSRRESASVDFIVHDMEQISLLNLSTCIPEENSSFFTPASDVKPPQQYPFRNLSKFKKKQSRKDSLPEYTSTVSDVVLVKTLGDLSSMMMYFLDVLGTSSLNNGMHAHYPPGWKPRMVVSLDAEWRPSMKQGANNPVSILQLGTHDRVFLIDLLELCFMNHHGDNLTKEQMILSEFFTVLFSNPDIVKLGFGLRYDIKRLYESYHWLPCFERSDTQPVILSHVDILMLARISQDGTSTLSSKIGLNTLVSKVLGKSLDKEEQISDWGARPLTDSQIQYAVSDVSCLIDIYDSIVEQYPEILDQKTMTQCALNLFHIGGSQTSALSSRHQMTNPGEGRSMVKKRPLTDAVCDINRLQPFTGTHLPGGGKMGVVKACLQEDEAERATALYRIPRGGALIEMSNAFLMFVNIPSRMYPNTFELDGGGVCRMSWWTSPGQTKSHPVVGRMLSGEKSMHLFCRKEKDKYVYFGELEIDTGSIEEQDNGQIKLYYILKDYKVLSSSPQVSYLLSINDISSLST